MGTMATVMKMLTLHRETSTFAVVSSRGESPTRLEKKKGPVRVSSLLLRDKWLYLDRPLCECQGVQVVVLAGVVGGRRVETTLPPPPPTIAATASSPAAIHSPRRLPPPMTVASHGAPAECAECNKDVVSCFFFFPPFNSCNPPRSPSPSHPC